MGQMKTIQIKLHPNKFETNLLRDSSLAYIKTVNTLVSEMVEAQASIKKSSKDVVAPLNSAVKNQTIRDAKSVHKKSRKTGYKIISILKKPVIIWNNQNFTVKSNSIAMPFIINGKSKKLAIKAIVTDRDLALLNHATKVGTLRITRKNSKWIAQIAVEIQTNIMMGTKIMGVDLGIKVPAVCVTDEDEVRFIGNGRMIKQVRRHFKSRRKELGKAKKLKAIRANNDKEKRFMNDLDHKFSREIINFAIEHNVGIIRLEQLINIRKTTRTSRKNNHSLHNWSFYRLASYIRYKANEVGITIEYVNPAYTSQACPNCGHKHHAKDRLYVCSDCEYKGHRDLVGAKNIRYATVLSGNSLVA